MANLKVHLVSSTAIAEWIAIGVCLTPIKDGELVAFVPYDLSLKVAA